MMEIEEWRDKIKLLRNLEDLHDIEYRKNNNIPKNAIFDSNGKWFLKKMQNSRCKDKRIMSLTKHIILNSPFTTNH